MRSLREIKKITSVDGLIVGEWYIVYRTGDDMRRLLFKYDEYIDVTVYGKSCYAYWRNGYGDVAFEFDSSRYCVRASLREVREYFPDE